MIALERIRKALILVGIIAGVLLLWQRHSHSQGGMGPGPGTVHSTGGGATCTGSVLIDVNPGGVSGGTTSAGGVGVATIVVPTAAATLLIVGVEVDATTPGAATAVHDDGGLNQAMTAIGSPFTVSSGSTPMTLQFFGLLNPKSGGTPSFKVTYASAPNTNFYAFGVTFKGTITSSVAAATLGFNTNTGTAVTNTVTSSVSLGSGCVAVGWFGNIDGFSGTNGTLIGFSNTLVTNAAANYTTGAGSTVTLTATELVSNVYAAMIVGVQ